jgi:hypothetical protein
MTCASLPAIRNLLIRLYPGTFLSSIRSSKLQTPTPRGWNNQRSGQSGGHNSLPLSGSNSDFMELQSEHRPDVPPKDLPAPTMAVIRNDGLQAGVRLEMDAGNVHPLGNDEWPEMELPRQHMPRSNV